MVSHKFSLPFLQVTFYRFEQNIWQIFRNFLFNYGSIDYYYDGLDESIL